MDWTLELVVIPVTDVDRAKRFYGEQVGFVVDHDTRIGESNELRLALRLGKGIGRDEVGQSVSR